MDPDENLRRQRALADCILRGDALNRDTTAEAVELAELVQALHEWLSKGGFAPSAWKRGER